ncbi:DUF2867 domain-containing protein [Colwellia sp. RE-S-Sl-9]
MEFFTSIKVLNKPFNDRLEQKAVNHHFRDALSVKRNNKELTPSQIQYRIFAYLPHWVNALMRIRNYIVSFFGFEVGKEGLSPKAEELSIGDKAGFLTITEKYDDEIISFAEDKHIMIYISVAINDNDITVSTLVNKKTLIGRLYVNSILPFHYFIARTVLNNALKAGRI